MLLRAQMLLVSLFVFGCATANPESAASSRRSATEASSPNPSPSSVPSSRSAQITASYREVGSIPQRCSTIAEDVQNLRDLIKDPTSSLRDDDVPVVQQASFRVFKGPLNPAVLPLFIIRQYLSATNPRRAEDVTRADLVEAYGNARSRYYRQCARVHLSRQIFSRPVSFEIKRLDPGASFNAGSSFSQQTMIRRTNSTRAEIGGSLDVKVEDFWILDEVTASVEAKVSRAESVTIGEAVTLGENEVEGISGDVCDEWQVLRTEKYHKGYIEDPVLNPGLRTEFELVRGPGIRTINLCTSDPFVFE